MRQNKRDQEKIQEKPALPPAVLKTLLKQIGGLSRTGMKAGNDGDFEKAFFLMEEAISLNRELDKKCLEAKLLNNMGLLHTMAGAWDKAMVSYERAMVLVTAHYGTGNILYKTLQKNISYLFDPKVMPALE